jgi:hypothetical protein
MGRFLRVLDKLLKGISREEFSVWLFDSPVELSIECARRSLCEKVYLAREDLKRENKQTNMRTRKDMTLHYVQVAIPATPFKIETTYIKKGILSSCNVPSSVPQFCVKFGNQDRRVWYGVQSFVRLLRDATHVRNDTFVEFSNYFILKEITALDLTSYLIIPSITGVDTNHIGETFGVCDTLEQGNLTFFE